MMPCSHNWSLRHRQSVHILKKLHTNEPVKNDACVRGCGDVKSVTADHIHIEQVFYSVIIFQAHVNILLNGYHSLIPLDWLFNFLIKDRLIIYALSVLCEAFVIPIKLSPQQLIMCDLAFTSCSNPPRAIRVTFLYTPHSRRLVSAVWNIKNLVSEEIFKINAAGKTHAQWQWWSLFFLLKGLRITYWRKKIKSRINCTILNCRGHYQEETLASLIQHWFVHI